MTKRSNDQLMFQPPQIGGSPGNARPAEGRRGVPPFRNSVEDRRRPWKSVNGRRVYREQHRTVPTQVLTANGKLGHLCDWG